MIELPSRAATLLALLLALPMLLAIDQIATGQQPQNQPPQDKEPSAAQLPRAAHLPPLDLSSVALRGSNKYSDCAKMPTTGEADCDLEEVVFDGPTRDGSIGADGLISQAAHRINMLAFGPGVSLGNAGGWRNHKVDVDFMTIATRGISQARNLYLYKHAAGDTMGTYDYVYSDGGSTALSDESIKGDAIDMGETNGYFHGTVASTAGVGDLAPVLTFVSGNNWSTDGAPLLNISKGSIAGHITAARSAIASSGYLSSITVDNELPRTTAWGICKDAIPNNKLVQTNTPFSCNVSLQTGQFRAGGTVCVSGPNYPEQAPITQVETPTGGSQRITIAVRNPNGSGANIFQGGVCGQYISFDANLAASGYRSSYYAFGAIDLHHLIFGMNLKGGVSSDLPMASEAERFGVSGRDGYHLYPGCEVVTNKSIKADPVCEPNSVAWAAGDLVEAPHNVAVNTVGQFIDVQQNTPANGSLSSGDLIQFHGMGAVGGNFIARRTVNQNPYKIFTPFGGIFGAPDMHRVEGYFNSGLSFGDAPGAIVRVFGNADRSQTVMTLFAMPGGEVRWDPASSTLSAPKIEADNFAGLRGTSETIGGAALSLGSCATGKASISGATMSMVPVTVASTIDAPGFSAKGAFQVTAQVTAPNEVTVSVCAVIAGAPKPSQYMVALQ